MAGLTNEGFTALDYDELVTRISGRLDAFSPGIDLSVEAPDGQLVHIMAFEFSQLWTELGFVYNSYNPNVATGGGLRNLGLISGLQYGAATRSTVNVELLGTSGTVVPKSTIFTDGLGNEFETELEATIPSTVIATAVLSGSIAVPIGTVVTISSPITGLTSITQTTAGEQGSEAQTENQFRNLRNRTVLRNYVAVEDVIQARLFETLGIEQVVVLNNDDPTTPLSDGTPAQTIHVTVGELSGVTNEEIAQVILATKGLGCPTFGSTSVVINDVQGNPHTVKFSKATVQEVFINVEILFLDEEYAGAEEAIKQDLVDHVNSLLTDEDVVWSRLFGIITPYAKAQVNLLELGTDGIAYNPTNISVAADKYASTATGQISITVVN